MVSLYLTSLPVMANDVNSIYYKGKKKNTSYSKEEHECEDSYSYRESNNRDGDFMDELIVRKSESVVIPGDGEGTYFDVDNYISNMFL